MGMWSRQELRPQADAPTEWSGPTPRADTGHLPPSASVLWVAGQVRKG